MKILYYRKDNKLLPGILTDKGVIGIYNSPIFSHETQYLHLPLTWENIESLQQSMQSFSERFEFIPEADLVIGPCVPLPNKIICIGLNYRKHATESGMAIPLSPIVFSKFNNTLTDYNSDVNLGTQGNQFDYEVELGVVIGRKCKNVSRENALKFVSGYCVSNDLSCRDLQFKTSQWLLGKTPDQFLPLGKYMVTADEIDDPQRLQLTCTFNGELRQNSNTADMIFSVAEVIEYLSKHMTLEPGDLILTGTPEGVIMGMPEKKWLEPEDVVRVEIEKLGYTENKMV